jgi:hypothetical protein
MVTVVIVIVVRPGRGSGLGMLVRSEVGVVVMDHVTVDQMHVPERHILHDRAGQPGDAERHPDRPEGGEGADARALAWDWHGEASTTFRV